ncbi:SIS domain-containing protein [Kribbella qitaiheensis]|uniref:Glutamine--fructose-6-phosphate aminotransferase [isomerizing] n=1 Tax=Kribbella qitaiheensis TaxID=1544730 RepID=A0A7G6X5D2_9ACTN|nr:SIS domain-containing protein [Kribbella qitaiheensis]QNE21447.1 SIS domain-containing protein [Kribbella qitaiheensis]
MSPQLTPFEQDMLAQPGALSDLLGAGPTAGADDFIRRGWDRVVLTGMGSSHFAGIPTWRALTQLGLPCWLVDAGTLLETPELVTPNTLVIATSQSGASGEVVEATSRLRERWSSRIGILGITADATSPLADTADLAVLLHSGPEATVSTKSYLNTLGVHHRLTGIFRQTSASELDDELAGATEQVAVVVQNRLAADIGSTMLSAAAPRLVAVGKRDATATALYAALIMKEAAKVAVEGFVGGQFRHGPFELAGEGMTAMLYGAETREDDTSLNRLAEDLLSVGTSVILVGDVELPGARTLPTGGRNGLESLMTGAVVAQHLAVEVAHANGVQPGAFVFGNKVTTTL